MAKEAFWKKELKEILAISSVFFVIFLLFIILKKVLLGEYIFDFYAIGIALVGSLIIAKVVLIFDLLPLTKRMDHLPNIYRVFFRSLIYIFGFIIFSLLEHLIKELIAGETFSSALNLAFHHLGTAAFITTMVGVFIAFLFFNAFWVIRLTYGQTALYDLFFSKK